MYTLENYIWGWVFYLFGALLFIGCWWYLTRKIPYLTIRLVLRAVVAVGLLVPYVVDSQQDFLAPAIIIAPVEAVFNGSEAFWRAGFVLLISLLLALIASISYGIWNWYRRGNNRAEPHSNQAEDLEHFDSISAD